MALNLEHLPQARCVQVVSCDNPQCRRPHVILFDDNGKPFAQFVCPDPNPDRGFLHDLKAALYAAAVERHDG